MALVQDTKPLLPLTMNMDEVFLTITVGNFQIGSNVVWFDGNPPILKGDISQQSIGKRQDLVGKKLWIITTVLDSNIVTNNVVVTIGFKGTSSPPIVLTHTLDNTGDIYALTTEYTFN